MLHVAQNFCLTVISQIFKKRCRGTPLKSICCSSSRGMDSFRGMIPGFMVDAKKKVTRMITPRTHCERPRRDVKIKPGRTFGSREWKYHTPGPKVSAKVDMALGHSCPVAKRPPKQTELLPLYRSLRYSAKLSSGPESQVRPNLGGGSLMRSGSQSFTPGSLYSRYLLIAFQTPGKAPRF